MIIATKASSETKTEDDLPPCFLGNLMDQLLQDRKGCDRQTRLVRGDDHEPSFRLTTYATTLNSLEIDIMALDAPILPLFEHIDSST